MHNPVFHGIGIILRYFLFWLSYFVIFRGVFLLYHFQQTVRLDSHLIFGTFYHGMKMDISFSSYLCLFIFLSLATSSFISIKVISKIITVYTSLFIAAISFISVADLELFTEWGFRIDATPITYLSTPREMAVSASSSPFILLILSIILVTAATIWLFKRTIHPKIVVLSRIKPLTGLRYLFMGALMIIPIRGGLQLAPMNQSVAFFSRDDFANQAAINVPWNFFWSINKQLYSRKNPYLFLPEKDAQSKIAEYYSSSSIDFTSVLLTDKPNVIVIIWESLTSKVLPVLGGNYANVIPEFEALIPEGILFKNFYANGERSDKGIVAVLSGYPALPKRSIVKIPVKSSKLPVLSKVFNASGYYTGFYHGGELNFANIKSYLVGADFNTIVGKKSFNNRDMNSKWGAHDHVVLERALKEISLQPTPFFDVIFTLSSHEPFEIPVAPKFPGEDLESLYLSSLHYTDQSIGNFIKMAKTQPWYENTLIIILADHGHRLLDDAPRYEKGKYHIPMLWLGGALSLKDSIIVKTCSQTDVAKTLLSQTRMNSAPFEWSRDIFNSNSTSGAFYVFNEGVGYIKDHQQLVYDHPSGNLLQRTDNITDEEVVLLKAHLQVAYQDYLNK